MSKRGLIVLIALAGLVLAGAALWKIKPWTTPADSGAVIASGTVEATEVSISFRMAGILRNRPVDEGSVVKVGELLAELDTREANARLQQALAAEQAAQARLKDLAQGYRPEEIAEAQAQVQHAEVNLRNLEEELDRSERLFGLGFISHEKRDKDAAAVAMAAAQYRAAAQRLKLLRGGFRKETIAVARAQLAEAQAAVEAARVALEDLRVTSTINGTVTRKHAEPGEMLATGRPVVTITDLAQPWVRVYIPEQRIGKVRLGAPARIKVDTFPNREFAGRVSYVSSQAEFTPKNVQTQEERVKLVFAVNVSADNPDGILKPGMPADVYIQTDAGAMQ